MTNGVGAQPTVALWRPGIIPLRPLSLTEIFNGAVAYARANPAPTLALTTGVVLLTSTVGLLLELLGAPAVGALVPIPGLLAGGLAATLATWMLTGMLTVVVARSVLGHPITVNQAWQQVRTRLAALIALLLLEILAAALILAAAALVIAEIGKSSTGWAAALVGIPLGALTLAVLTYIATMLALAPAALVLERRNIVGAIRRSHELNRRRFWRTLGILALAFVAVGLVATSVSVPFDIASSVLAYATPADLPGVGATMIATVGSAVGQIITAPFIAGVLFLLYTDARFRSEAFDFTLLTCARDAAEVDAVWQSR